jgi:hypothetical protein
VRSFTGRNGRGAHDCLVVTLLAVLPALEVVVVGEALDAVVAVEVVGDALDAVVAEEVVEVLWAASAGSCPEISTSAMNSQVATNSDRAAAITRRRIVRARTARAWLAALAVLDLMVSFLVRSCDCSVDSVTSARSNSVSDR